jgi:hypothetical protein
MSLLIQHFVKLFLRAEYQLFKNHCEKCIKYHCCPVKNQYFNTFNISLLCSFDMSLQLLDYKYFAALQHS